ncbi:hypothetical protein LZG73_07940 [Dyadobacter sp. CY326]|nr:hypothetical protein [Dyadobacter sp. CY326]
MITLFLKSLQFLLLCVALLMLPKANAQSIKLNTNTLEPFQAYMSLVTLNGKSVIKVVKDSTIKGVDEPTFVKIRDVDFHNGTIEVKVLSKLLKNAPQSARGFIGVAFRINDDNSRYESIYIRPTNGRANEQVRRNHSIQYYSYPDYKFDRLRKEAPEKYESYADMDLNRWITMRIEVSGLKAKLFLDNRSQPALIVNDLFHGPDLKGAIALWVEVGTEGYFCDLKVTKKD